VCGLRGGEGVVPVARNQHLAALAGSVPVVIDVAMDPLGGTGGKATLASAGELVARFRNTVAFDRRCISACGVAQTRRWPLHRLRLRALQAERIDGLGAARYFGTEPLGQGLFPRQRRGQGWQGSTGATSKPPCVIVRPMTPEDSVRRALKQAHDELPERHNLLDLAFLRDLDPYGTESLLVYVKIRRGSAIPPETKREVEERLRKKLKSTGYPVFFRWLSEGENNPDKPSSALHSSAG
jgi:hypothetical protein